VEGSRVVWKRQEESYFFKPQAGSGAKGLKVKSKGKGGPKEIRHRSASPSEAFSQKNNKEKYMFATYFLKKKIKLA